MKRILTFVLIVFIMLPLACIENKIGRDNPLESDDSSYDDTSDDPTDDTNDDTSGVKPGEVLRAPIMTGPTQGLSYIISWEETGARSYYVEESKTSDFTDVVSYEVNVNSLEFSHDESGQIYYYRVRTNTGVSDSDWSNVVSVTIAQSPWDLFDMKYMSIESGAFTMGDIQDLGESDEHPTHRVNVSAFEIGVFEVTQKQYTAVIGSNPSKNYGVEEEYPVYYVSWYDAVKFCNILSDEAGLGRCYDENTWECDFSQNGFRLPTEAEWEYACRAESETAYNIGNEESDLEQAGWYKSNSRDSMRTVGRRQANAWGLHDMHGNVWEWCNDWYNDWYYKTSPKNDPTGEITGHYRVKRGGDYSVEAELCRSANREHDEPEDRHRFLGVRLVRRN